LTSRGKDCLNSFKPQYAMMEKYTEFMPMLTY